MAITFVAADAEEFAAYAELDARNFGAQPMTAAAIDASRAWIDFEHSVAVRDGGRLVGFGASRPSQISVPGGELVSIRELAWVSVTPTHTRRGLLVQMMAFFDDAAAKQGEAVLALQASGGGIYERFGYGSSTSTKVCEINPRLAQIQSRYQVDRSKVEIGGIAMRQKQQQFQLDTFAHYQRHQVGETSLDTETLDVLVSEASPAEVYAEHPDGFAVWSMTSDWNEGHPRHRIDVDMVVANTTEAHIALWSTILGSDLVASVRTRRALGPDDPLPLLLTNPRELRTVEHNDGIWLNVLDPISAFSARTYRTDDQLVIAVADAERSHQNNQPLSFTVGPDGSRLSGGEPDLTVTKSALGPLLLGSVSPSRLALAKRVTASRAALTRADAMLGHSPTAHTQIPF